MRWFNKAEQKNPWDDEVAGPLDDLAAAKKIRTICNVASANAQKLSGSAGGPRHQGNQRDTERYVRAARTAMEIAMKISNDPIRDAAVRQIIGLCMLLDNLQTAQILVRAIRAETIKAEVLKEYPMLRQ
jgi:hypothetical protein